MCPYKSVSTVKDSVQLLTTAESELIDVTSVNEELLMFLLPSCMEQYCKVLTLVIWK